MKRTACRLSCIFTACLMFAVMSIARTALAGDTVQPVIAETAAAQPAAIEKTGQMLNLNTASAAELTKLPGIGPKAAQAIIDKRNELGGTFTALEQLLKVKGIKQKKFEKIKPLLTL